MKTLVQEEKGREIFEPLHNALLEIHAEALAKLNKMLEIHPLNNRSKPQIMSDCIMSGAKERFKDYDGAFWVEKYNSVILVLKKGNESVGARFKKFNDKGLPSNARTSRNQNILSQQYEIEFEDAPKRPTFVEIGYAVNRTWTDFASIKIVCRVNKNPLWHIDLVTAEGETIRKSIITTEKTALEIVQDARVTVKKDTGTDNK